MTHAVRALLALCLAVSLASAQAAPPPTQMKKLDRLLGFWTGSGTVLMAPGAAAMTWESTSHARKVMDGQFIRDDMTIAFEGLPDKMAFVSFYAWDAHRNCFVTYGASSSGEITTRDLFFTDDDTMLQTGTAMQEGMPTIERWTTKLGKGSYHVLGESALTSGGLFHHVEGTMKKVVDGKPQNGNLLDGIGPFMTAPSKEMKKLAAMAGTYAIKGSYAMAPETDPIDFEGTEVFTMLFGGMVMESLAAGEGYEGYGVMVWDAREKCYQRFELSSWGVAATSTARWVGDHSLSFTYGHMFMDQYMIGRNLMKTDEHGHPHKMVAYNIMGDADPFKNFEATYALKPAKGN